MATMNATVLRVNPRSLLVRDMSTGQEVLVNTNNAQSFRVGDVIRITYNGQVTASIPPQISATNIVRINQPQPQPQQTEIRRATVLQVRNNALLVRDPSNLRQVIVNFAYTHHFCVGQLVNIRYDSIVLSNPVQVNATDVLPIC